MLVEWSVECSSEDPILEVPWSDPEGTSKFVDLRENPYDLDHVAEADRYPPLMQALRALNAARSPVFTAKCDAWVLEEDELEQLRFDLDLHGSEYSTGFASYIDLVWRERTIFASFHQHEQMLHRLTRYAEPIEAPRALLDCILRPALVDFSGPHEGFAVSLYVKALCSDEHSALDQWASALEAVIALIRGKELGW